MTRRRLIGAALALPLASTVLGTTPAAADTAKKDTVSVEDRIDWPAFMARQDLVWDTTPHDWDAGAFIGNGLLGSMIYATGDEALHWDVGRSDVVDRGNRLAIGRFVLNPAGKAQKSTMRLDLWNAEARGTLTTDRGDLRWRSFTHAQDPVTLIEWESTGGEDQARFAFVQEPALPAREVYRKEPIPEDARNPDPTAGETNGVSWRVQKFRAGGGYVVAWQEAPEAASPGKHLLAFSVDYGKPSETPKPDRAVAAVRSALSAGAGKLEQTHRDWWHHYWPQGFLSVPNARMESFYWAQMYKLASATRADRPALDLMGPWFRTTPWPRIWWNLNIQLTYWPVYTANRLELGESLTRMLDAGQKNLIANVPEEWRADSAAIGRTSSYDCAGKVGSERGNLTWTLHNYWLQYRYSGDEAMLKDRLYPLLKRSVGYYLHLLTPGPDGKLHLSVSTSPEYPDQAPDTNYDLSLLRWGLTTLLATDERFRLHDPLAPRWRETLEKLTPYPVDEQTGYEIGAGMPLTKSHRHFSHLLMVYPLHLVDPHSAADRPLIEKSLDHWMGLGNAHRGYSFTGSSAMSSWLGRKDDAVHRLDQFLDRYVKANTMYLEAGPVIETPLSAAASLQEILLQSWTPPGSPFGTDIRVFPAVPDSWKDASFQNLRAEGAFLVSAVRRDGKTRFVSIQSLAGAPCRVHTDLPEPLIASGSRTFTLKTERDANGERVIDIDLKKGETVLLTSGAEPLAPADRAVMPVADTRTSGVYGLHAGGAVAPAAVAKP